MTIYSIIDPRVQIQKMIPTANGKQITIPDAWASTALKVAGQNMTIKLVNVIYTHTNSKDCATNACKWTKVDETVHIKECAKMTNSGGEVQNYDSNQVWYLLD